MSTLFSRLPLILQTILVVSAVAAPCLAATATVGSVAGCSHSNLADAISHVQAVDDGPHTIRVFTSQKVETYTVIEEPMTIVGGYSSCADPTPDGEAPTIQVGSATGLRISKYDGSEPMSVTVRNLTLVGTSTNSLGLWVIGNVQVDLEEVSVRDMETGGMWIESAGSSRPLVKLSASGENRWERNGGYSSSGGAISCRGAGLRISDTLFADNAPGQSPDYGGAIRLVRCDLLLGANVGFQGNRADRGAAIAAESKSRISTSGAQGAAWQSNRAEEGGDFLYLNDSEAVFHDRTIGGANADGSSTIWASNGSKLRLSGSYATCSGSSLCSNLSGNQSSRLLRLEGGSQARFSATTLGGGVAAAEGVIQVENSELTIEHSIVSVNEGESIVWARGDESTRVALRYVSMTENSATQAAFVTETTGGNGPVLEVLSSIVWEETIPTLLASMGASQEPNAYCLLASSYFPGERVLIGEDPLFVDPPLDVHLSVASPAVDFCDDAMLGDDIADFDQEVRGTDQLAVPNRFPGATFDLGIDEVFGASAEIFSDGFEIGGPWAWDSY